MARLSGHVPKRESCQQHAQTAKVTVEKYSKVGEKIAIKCAKAYAITAGKASIHPPALL